MKQYSGLCGFVIILLLGEVQSDMDLMMLGCPKISEECRMNHKDIAETEKSFMDPDFAMNSLICFLGNNTVEECDDLAMKNKMALPLAFNDICLDPCEGYNACVLQAGKRFLCQIRSLQPQIFQSLKNKYMPNCDPIPEMCLADYEDIRNTDANLHNPIFLAKAMSCFMGEGLTNCKNEHLLIKNKMALPLAFNKICMHPCEGYNQCVQSAGSKFLCILQNVQPILFEALEAKYMNHI